MKKIKVGVLGVYRGTSMINYCKIADNAELVAICDKWEEGLERHKKDFSDMDIAYYTTFDEFIKHDMDVVVLANYANEHAPFAIAAMKAGKHVFSEVLPIQTMKEAVELIEAVEETGKIYGFAENYCYMPAPYEMKELYQKGEIGEFEYGECEYIHNCEPIWASITYGERDHWRNNMYANFYCTHSLGPIIHATKLRPVRVVGFEGIRNERNVRCGSNAGQFAIEMVTLENGGIIKSVHGGLYKDSIWYSMYGSKGRMECAREDAEAGHIDRIYVNKDEFSGQYAPNKPVTYLPEREHDSIGKHFGHGGSDFYSIYNYIEKIRGNENADIIDVYEALDMFLPGMFAFRSVLAGNQPMEIPDLRNKAEREKWRNDTACTDKNAAGDMLLPVFSGEIKDIDDSVYEKMREKWLAELEADEGYTKAAFSQGNTKKEK